METSIQTFMNTVKVIFEENTTEKVGASVKILTCGRLLYIYPYKRGFVLHYSRQTRPDVCSLLPAPPSSTLSPRNGQLHPSVPRSTEVRLYHDGHITATETPPLSSHRPSAARLNLDHNLSGC
ncbi:uncharacterized protein [Triticum aestivum]|uniref:uncharacterized protein isoform X1 n=1 Tax=Triticum aestivum TaxID=4565 RepID=UPI001D027926|nr:uncharacterized protein LOC123110384 isoform X1 [Triticum aestivum]